MKQKSKVINAHVIKSAVDLITDSSTGKQCDIEKNHSIICTMGITTELFI
jgi:hypothetical protein